MRQCRRKVASGRSAVGAIGFQVNARGLQELLFVPILVCKRSRIRAVQLDNLRGLLGIRRMDKVPNAQIWSCV